MIVLFIILILLILLMILPVGVDAAYEEKVFALGIKIGPIRLGILPQSEKARLKSAAKKAEKKAKKADAKSGPKKAKKPKKKPDLDTIFAFAKMGVHALAKLKNCLSIDLLKMHFVSGGPDPYNTAMLCGYVSAGCGSLLGVLHNALHIERQDVDIRADFDLPATTVDARLILTIQIWEIFYLAFAFLIEFLKWRWARKKAARIAAAQAPVHNTTNIGKEA